MVQGLGLEQAAQLNLNGYAPGLTHWWRLREDDTHVERCRSESQARVLAWNVSTTVHVLCTLHYIEYMYLVWKECMQSRASGF